MATSPRAAALMTSILFLLSASTMAFAADYERQALEYLSKKLSIPADAIVLDGHTRDLPLAGEQVWMGRYYVPGEDDAGRGGEPEVDPESDPAEAGAGVIYILTGTGETLDHEEAQALFDREAQLQRAERERLSREAGNIEVSLYIRLKEAAPDRAFEVIIWPAYLETEEMRRAIDAIISDYPSLTYREPAYPGAGTPPGMGVEPAEPGDAHILPMPIVEDREAEATDAPLPDDRAASDEYLPPDVTRDDEEIWELYAEMYERLHQVYGEGFSESLAAIESVLENMGAALQVEGNSFAVTAELTAVQILSLQNVDYIKSVGEIHYLRTAEDSDALQLEAAPAVVSDTAVEDSDETGSPSAGAWVGASLVVLAAGAAFIINRWRKSN